MRILGIHRTAETLKGICNNPRNAATSVAGKEHCALLLDPCRAHVFHNVSLRHGARQLCFLYVGAPGLPLLLDLNSFQPNAMLHR